MTLGLKKNQVAEFRPELRFLLSGYRDAFSPFLRSRRGREGGVQGQSLAHLNSCLMIMIMSCIYTVPFIRMTLQAEFMLAIA